MPQKFTQSQKKDTIPKGLVSQMLENNLEFLLDSKGNPEAHLALNGPEGGIISVGLHMLGNHGIYGETGVAGIGGQNHVQFPGIGLKLGGTPGDFGESPC